MAATGEQALASAYQDFPAILAGLERRRAEDASPEVIQRAAVATFGRRAAVAPSSEVLLQDAFCLLGEVLEASHVAYTEKLADSGRWRTRIIVPGKPQEEQVREHDLETDSAVRYAIELAEPVLFEDLKTETRFGDAFLRGLKIATGVVAPLLTRTGVEGILAAYRGKGEPFTRGDLEFAESLAHLLAATSAREKAESELADKETLARVVVDSLQAPVISVDFTGRIRSVNLACVELSGKGERELCDHLFWEVFAAPEEQPQVRQAFEESRGKRGMQLFHSHPVGGGMKRTLAWRMINNFDGDGAVRSITMLAQDLTELLALQEEIDRYRQLIDQQGSGDDKPGNPAESVGVQVEARSPVGYERRSSPRLAFPYTQRIAPVFGGVIPSRRRFFEVRCRDISAGGISFLLESPPEFESLVVALGHPPAESFFTARVVRVQECREGDKTWILVGCRFTGRVYL
ncbi:hypothetical protein JCM19992_30820 [Thermostilla marina]